MLAVIRSRWVRSTASQNVTGTLAASAIRTVCGSPAVPATIIPSTPIIDASRTGCARSSITDSSCTAITPRIAIPAAKIQPPS